jgi:hypothetical protein
MPELITIKRVALGPQHLRPGRTKHRIRDAKGAREFAPFVALEIASYPNEHSYYLFHISENGEVADTWHQTLEEAFDQAEWEFWSTTRGVVGGESALFAGSIDVISPLHAI